MNGIYEDKSVLGAVQAGAGADLDDARLRAVEQLTAVELLDLLDDLNAADAREDRPVNTRIAYAGDWAVWTEFCGTLGVPLLTARPGLFRTFVKHLESRPYAPSTIQRRLAGVITCLRDNGLVIPEKGGPAAPAWERIRAYEGELRKAGIELGRGQAPPLGRVLIRQAVDRLPVGLFGLRDKVIVLLGYAIGARQSEIANLLTTDITLDPQGRGMEVHVRYTKGGRERTVPVHHATDPRYCPVRAYQQWTQQARIQPEGPAICQIRGRINIAACPDEAIRPNLVTERLHVVEKKLDEPINVTGHSLRSGRVTDLFEDGADVADICAITGHSPKSGTVYDYNRRGEMWANKAATLGL